MCIRTTLLDIWVANGSSVTDVQTTMRARNDSPLQSLTVLVRLAVIAIAAVAACRGTVTPAPSAPPALASPVHEVRAPGSFADNPIVYFVMTDRFANGDPSNDHSYGRQREAQPKDDVGTFHGGDLRGLTDKLVAGWFDKLGVNALWITAPYEQIHGWVIGGDKEFKHYAYHGYYALDYTVLDQNMGTPDELRALVAAAHARGIRILFDVVMNHPGYLDIETARQLGLKVLWPGAENATLADYHNFIDYNNFSFRDWWGGAWVRAGLPGYPDGGRDDLTSQLAFLPDFRTESTAFVHLPVFLAHKPGTRAVELPGTTVRGYLIAWLTDWVRSYGIDGFRCDTVKHVEPEAWAELKRAASAALAAWKAQHPRDKIDDAPFWMVGEYWGHGPARGPLHDAGFDAMINFELQGRVASIVAGKPGELDALFSEYAELSHGRPAHMLSYLSSHDTALFDRGHLIEAGTALLLAPGGVQIFYGDEAARPPGPAPTSDAPQATRSDMPWDHLDQAVLAHWRALGSFRARHVAIAHGIHARLAAQPYVFSRVDRGPDASSDRVVVAIDVPAGATLPLGTVFSEGQALRDAYAGVAYVVHGGSITVASASRVVLLERMAR
jgi:alpha-amylase